MRYLKFLNLIPLGIFFVMYFLSGSILHMAPLIMVAVLGIMNAFVSKNLKEYVISTLMLLVSCAVGMIGLTYYYYYFVQAADEAPIIGAFVVMVYGIIVMMAFAVGAVIMVIRNRRRKNAII